MPQQCRVHFQLLDLDGFKLSVAGQGDWIDSSGLPLVLGSTTMASPHAAGLDDRLYPGGPPIGYNIVFTFDQPLHPWPPPGAARVPYRVLFAPGLMSMGSHGALGIPGGAAPPPYSAGGGVTVATAVSAPGAVATAVPVNLHFCSGHGSACQPAFLQALWRAHNQCWCGLL